MIKEYKNYKILLVIGIFMVVFSFSQAFAEDLPVSELEPTQESVEQVVENNNPEPEPESSETPGDSEEELIPSEEETVLEIPEEEAAPRDEDMPVQTEDELILVLPEEALVDTEVATSEELVLSLETINIASGEAEVEITEDDGDVEPAFAESSGMVKEKPTVLSAEIEFTENEPVDTTHLVDTTMIRRPVFNGPTVIAQWQMSASIEGAIVGRDDSTVVGTQLLPSGGYQINRSYSICALASDEFGEIESAVATIKYPEDIVFGIGDENRSCGQLKSIFDLEKLESKEASDLFCDNIRNHNNNLINWNKDRLSHYTYSYEQICGVDGLLKSGETVVFCGEDKLFYDDPAGDYQVAITVSNNQDKMHTSYNDLKIMELTMFEANFSDFQYGLVEEMNWKIVFGDTNWENSSTPTIRNIGNTRLKIIIDQNDFGFGKTGDEWNISYRARLGSALQFTTYLPNVSQAIEAPVNLGESVKMDFAVFVKRFPDKVIPAFSGSMTLSAEKVNALKCK